ncbi:MAG: hypothetical protein A2X58_14075 [Nitrospirae bacterium GWC2_56_14]|nr:MAG: hypothetical protein A2X58_14075 [Nitrospirae bacterium GWC2_56_14]
MDCKGCHGDNGTSVYGEPDSANGGAGLASANSHTLAGHVSAASDCGKCHANTSTNGTSITGASHINNAMNVDLNASYDTNGATANYNGTVGQKTCSATTCHGAGTPKWGANTTSATCVKCHGVAGTSVASYGTDSRTAAPGYNGTGVDTSGSNGAPLSGGVSPDQQVGAHDTHLKGTGGYKLGGITCADCHAVTALGDAGHMNGSTTMTWSNLAKNIGTDPYNADKGPIVPGYTAPNCTTNYCHGGAFAVAVQGTGLTASWTGGAYLANAGSAMNSLDCNKCHQSPPTGSLKDNHSGVTLGAGGCSGCHNHDGYGDVRHINGILEASGACNTCHAYPPTPGDGKVYRAVEGKGAHTKHINHLVALRQQTVPGFALNPITDQFGSGDSWTYVCGVCHNNATHEMSEVAPGNGRHIEIPAAYAFGGAAQVYNAAGPTKINTSSAANPKNCSNVSCHFKTTPVWEAY